MKSMHRIKPVLLLALAAILLTCGVGGTMAYLVTADDPVENVFQPAQVTSEVIEPNWVNGESTEKKDVTIKNTGNVEANIRAAIVVTWQDASGKTMATVPVKGVDYTLDIGSNWTLNNDYYYYNATVSPGAATTALITSCEYIGQYTDGRRLCVEVIGSAIQAQPTGGTQWQIPTGNSTGN